MRSLLIATLLAAVPQSAEKQLVVTITAEELRGGMVSEITWDGGVLFLQGVFAEPGGELKPQYFVVAADRIRLDARPQQTPESLKYWQMKASRLSPTGMGRITLKSDTKMPQFGVGNLERRIDDAVDMGGTQTNVVVSLGSLKMFERPGVEPYDGEMWSWSPPELNQIAYVDGKGDLWIARADGRDARRVMKGDFTLPAWSPDGRAIAVAERKDRGRKWEISVIHLRSRAGEGSAAVHPQLRD